MPGDGDVNPLVILPSGLATPFLPSSYTALSHIPHSIADFRFHFSVSLVASGRIALLSSSSSIFHPIICIFPHHTPSHYAIFYLSIYLKPLIIFAQRHSNLSTYTSNSPHGSNERTNERTHERTNDRHTPPGPGTTRNINTKLNLITRK